MPYIINNHNHKRGFRNNISKKRYHEQNSSSCTFNSTGHKKKVLILTLQIQGVGRFLPRDNAI